VIRIDESAAERVLVLTPTGRDAELLRDRIVAAGMSCEVCSDLHALLAGISVGAGAAVIAQEALPKRGAEELLATLEAQEPWSDIPVLLLSDASSKRPRVVSSFFERANVTLLQRPLVIQVFLSSVRSAVRARQRQYQMRDLHDELERVLQLNRLSAAKFSGIISTSADAIVLTDESQRITLFNDGAEKIFGYSKAEAVGAPLDTLIPERFRATHREHVERFAAGNEAARRMGNRGTAIFGLRKNGEEFPADAAISKIGVDGTKTLTVALRDVTEQRRIESDQRLLAEMGAALATTLDFEETLTTIAQQAVRTLADFCIVDVLEEDGEIRRIRVVGRDPSKGWLCDSIRQFRIDSSRPSLCGSALRTKEPVLIEEVTSEVLASWAQSDEQLRVLQRLEARSLMVVPLLARGKVLAVLEFVSSTNPRAYGQPDLRLAEDIAYRATLAIENARLYRAAERATQARDEVLGVVAHDLRNPLGAILMQAALLRPRGAEPERRSRKPAEVIERAANRMDRLVNDLLDITRMDAGRLSIEQARVGAAALVTALVAAQEPLASSLALELRLDLAPDLGEIFADPDRLAQAVENLFANAVKFTRPGGRITVGAAPRDGEVLFWVADTGAGIEAGDVPHLFDRFWQAKKVGRQGAGLGLPIVKGIVEAHGGRIWVETQVGVGSTFFFTMPLARPDAPATGASNPPSEASSVTTREQPGAESRRCPRVVLVVEDDPDMRNALRETLQHAGYKVAEAANGAEALEYLHREAPPFLVIMDLEMPVMDGWAFLTERNRDRNLRSFPVIVVSGERDVEDRIVAAHASYVQKPILADRLIETMQRVGH